MDREHFVDDVPDDFDEVLEETEDESEIEDFVEVDDYDTILAKMVEDWMDIELRHRVSKTASNLFWDLSRTCFHRLFRAKDLQSIKKKTLSFLHIRKKLHQERVPPVHMEMAFQNKDTGVVSVVRDTKTRKNEFQSHEFQKLWEIGHVEVTLFSIIVCFCVLLGRT